MKLVLLTSENANQCYQKKYNLDFSDVMMIIKFERVYFSLFKDFFRYINIAKC